MGQHHSPYLAMGNNPVSSIDLDGGWDGYGGDDALRDYMYHGGTNGIDHSWFFANPFQRDIIQTVYGTSYESQSRESILDNMALGQGYQAKDGSLYSLKGNQITRTTYQTINVGTDMFGGWSYERSNSEVVGHLSTQYQNSDDDHKANEQKVLHRINLLHPKLFKFIYGESATPPLLSIYKGAYVHKEQWIIKQGDEITEDDGYQNGIVKTFYLKSNQRFFISSGGYDRKNSSVTYDKTIKIKGLKAYGPGFVTVNMRPRPGKTNIFDLKIKRETKIILDVWKENKITFGFKKGKVPA